VKNDNGDLLADSHSILNRCKLLNVYRVSDVRQVEIHATELLVTDHSPFEVEVAVAKLKSIICQVVMKFRQNRFKQEVKRCGLSPYTHYFNLE
jgi:hypothetical protein